MVRDNTRRNCQTQTESNMKSHTPSAGSAKTFGKHGTAKPTGKTVVPMKEFGGKVGPQNGKGVPAKRG